MSQWKERCPILVTHLVPEAQGLLWKKMVENCVRAKEKKDGGIDPNEAAHDLRHVTDGESSQ